MPTPEGQITSTETWNEVPEVTTDEEVAEDESDDTEQN